MRTKWIYRLAQEVPTSPAPEPGDAPVDTVPAVSDPKEPLKEEVRKKLQGKTCVNDGNFETILNECASSSSNAKDVMLCIKSKYDSDPVYRNSTFAKELEGSINQFFNVGLKPMNWETWHANQIKLTPRKTQMPITKQQRR